MCSEQSKVIQKDDPLIKVIALAWRCKSLVPCLALICAIMTQVAKYLSRFLISEMEITFHFAWEFYLASHVQTARCSRIASVGVQKACEHSKDLINTKEVGFCLQHSLACGKRSGFWPPHLGNPICNQESAQIKQGCHS